MKRIITILSVSLILLPLILACSSNEQVDQENTQVNVAESIEFKVNVGDYNDEEVSQNTRAVHVGDTLSVSNIELNNGLLAEVSVVKDKKDSSQDQQLAKTRVLPNGSYTMLAYQGGELKGELKGSIAGGSFIPTPSGTKDLLLVPGTYDFVLFNDNHFTRNGNLLKLTHPNGSALIGRVQQTITATPRKQHVTFIMLHACARVRLRLTIFSKVDFFGGNPSFSVKSETPTSVPAELTYNILTGEWSDDPSATHTGAFAGGTNFKNLDPSKPFEYTSDYNYVFPKASLGKAKVSFFGIRIYDVDLSWKTLSFSLDPVLSTVANGSYLVNITFRYNFLYLMADGSVGTYKETTSGGGSKTPIGLVVSRSKRLAVALQNAPGGPYNWISTTMPGWTPMYNSTTFIPPYGSNPVDYDGYKWTWNADGSADGTTIKANEKDKYPAFYAAGHYTPTLPAGVTLSGTMIGKKWHLPSISEVETAYSVLRTSLHVQPMDAGGMMFYYPLRNNTGGLNSSLMGLAFGQVGGTSMHETLTSTEIDHNVSVFNNNGHNIKASIGEFDTQNLGEVRPFIIY